MTEELKLLRESYLMLQRLSNKSILIALETDHLRAALRNKIADGCNIECEYLQGDVEGEAIKYPLDFTIGTKQSM